MAWKATVVVLAIVAIAVTGCSEEQNRPFAEATPAGQAAPVVESTAAVEHAERQIVNVYNWPDYIGEDTIHKFEASSGIKVNYMIYSDGDALERQLMVAPGEHDVIFPPARPYAGRMIANGLLASLDKASLGDLDSLDPNIMTELASLDPNNEHLLPYLWGTTGMGLNMGMVKAALGANVPLDSWNLIFDPIVAQKLSKCGIGIVDSEVEGFSAALLWKGMDMNAVDDNAVLAVHDVYSLIRPYIRKFSTSSELIKDLADGRLCLVLTYSGDVDQARNAAAEAAEAEDKEIPDIRYIIPREGALRWIDVVAIPSQAKHVANAHKFIRYLMTPEVIADISNTVSYANANLSATPLIEKSIAENPGVYPPANVRAKLRATALLSDDNALRRKNAWNRIVYGGL